MYKKSSKAESDSDKKPKLSYWSKTKCRCPVCQRDFAKEEMLTGSGRMNAGDLTDELHRNYIPSEKYGAVYPLIYSVGACPRCHVAFLWKDFEEITDKASIDALRDDDDNRKQKVSNIFPHYDLEHERNLLDGAAMYYLALLSYEKVDLAYAPTFKRAMLSLRLAWICNHLNEAIPGYNYDYVAKLFYQKATFFYEQTMINETGRIETFASVSNFGPDIDKNYGYDGMIYLPEHEYYTSSSDHSYVLYVLPDGTRLGGQHQSALFDIEDDMFSGAEGFEYDKIYVVSYPNRVDVFPNGFMFNQTQSWAAFRNGVFVFAVKTDNEYQLWRIVRGSAEMIDSSNEPITLSRSGISDNNDGIFAQVGNKEYCFTRNAGFTVTEK